MRSAMSNAVSGCPAIRTAGCMRCSMDAALRADSLAGAPAGTCAATVEAVTVSASVSARQTAVKRDMAVRLREVGNCTDLNYSLAPKARYLRCMRVPALLRWLAGVGFISASVVTLLLLVAW